MVIIPIAPMERMEFQRPDIMASADPQGTSMPFANVLSDAMASLEETKEVASKDAYRLVMGDVDNIAQIQINGMKAEAMVNTTIQLTTRLVNAYKEILQMQV